MTGDERVELGDDLTLTPEREIRLDPFLDDVQVELLKPSDLLLRERVERELGERRAAPEAQRLTEERRRLGRRARGERRPAPSRAVT